MSDHRVKTTGLYLSLLLFWFFKLFRSSFHGSDVLTSLVHQTRMKFKAKLYALYELNVQGCCAIQLSRCIAAKAAFNVCPEACPSVQTERRRRDLNPCAAINDLLTFQASPFGLLGISPYKNNHFLKKRRGWDSNPRALSDKRFSRPPRYDHFDTSPLGCRCCRF